MGNISFKFSPVAIMFNMQMFVMSIADVRLRVQYLEIFILILYVVS